MKNYKIKKIETTTLSGGEWNGSLWGNISPLAINIFQPESSDHRPVVQAKLAYDNNNIYGIFKVDDQYVRCTSTEFQTSVCRDSCVEFFFKPLPDKGYFNFEFNCGGNILCYYISDNTRLKEKNRPFEKFEILDIDDLKQVEIYHSMPEVVEPEITTPITWFLEFRIPFAILQKYCGDFKVKKGTKWMANFYKCGDKTSHPHWASCFPISMLNFHLPECFGPLLFD